MLWRKARLEHDPAFRRAVGRRRPRGFKLEEPLTYLDTLRNAALTLQVAAARPEPHPYPVSVEGIFSGRYLTHRVTFQVFQVRPRPRVSGPDFELDLVGSAPLFYDQEIAFLDGYFLQLLSGVYDLEGLNAQFYNVIERYVQAHVINVLFVPVTPPGLDADTLFTVREAYWRFCATRGYRRASWDTLGKRLHGDDQDGLLTAPKTFDDGWEACISRRDDKALVEAEGTGR